ALRYVRQASCCGQWAQQSTVNQSLKVCHHAEGQGPIANEQANLDVPIQGSLCQVRGGDKNRLVVGDDGLRMKHASRSFTIEGSRIVEHARLRRPWPLEFPELLGEFSNELLRHRRIASAALDVQEQRDPKVTYCVHSSGQNFESARS